MVSTLYAQLFSFTRCRYLRIELHWSITVFLLFSSTAKAPEEKVPAARPTAVHSTAASLVVTEQG